MERNFGTYAILAIKILVALAFAAAGLAKLAGAEMMVSVFDALGFGQWFRYVTGVVEVVGAVLLFVPGKQAYGALLLVATMIGAVLSHIFILGPSFVPALILGILAGIVLVSHRDQLIGN